MVSFIEQLEDFGRPLLRDKTPENIPEPPPKEVVETVTESVDTALRVHPEELDALKKQAFEEGYQKSREETHKILLSQMIESVEGCFAFLEKEDRQRREMLERFLQNVFESLRSLLGEQISEKDFIQRKFSQDIVSFAKETLRDNAGVIAISCAESDEEALKNNLGQYGEINIKSDPDYVPGCVKIMSSRHELTLDRVEWQNKVREQIKSAIDHIKGLNRPQEGQEER